MLSVRSDRLPLKACTPSCVQAPEMHFCTIVAAILFALSSFSSPGSTCCKTGTDMQWFETMCAGFPEPVAAPGSGNLLVAMTIRSGPCSSASFRGVNEHSYVAPKTRRSCVETGALDSCHALTAHNHTISAQRGESSAHTCACARAHIIPLALVGRCSQLRRIWRPPAHTRDCRNSPVLRPQSPHLRGAVRCYLVLCVWSSVSDAVRVAAHSRSRY